VSMPTSPEVLLSSLLALLSSTEFCTLHQSESWTTQTASGHPSAQNLPAASCCPQINSQDFNNAYWLLSTTSVSSLATNLPAISA
jgi:hypothetical protein